MRKIRLVFALILALCMFTPAVYARRKVQVLVYTVPDFDNFVLYDNSEEMSNDFMKVDVGYRFFWYDAEWNLLGYAEQYVKGITKIGSGNDFSPLRGYGVFHSTVDGKPGTIIYELGNVWKPNDPFDPFDDEFWGDHLKISCGTEYFEGIKGQGVLNFEIFAFELYLDYNPWE